MFCRAELLCLLGRLLQTEPVEVRSCTLAALSALVSDNREGLCLFLTEGGMKPLIRSVFHMETSGEPLSTGFACAAYLLSQARRMAPIGACMWFLATLTLAKIRGARRQPPRPPTGPSTSPKRTTFSCRS